MIEFTIFAQARSLKNDRDIFPIKATKGAECPYCRRPLHMLTVLNKEAKAFERAFKKQLPEAAQRGWTMPVGVIITIYYPANRQDVDEALVLDLMQKYGVIGNDRQVVSKFVKKLIDPDRPRVVVKVLPVQWDRTGLQPTLYADLDPDVVHEMEAAG
jgi:Holliday junction resolvase RusA-like endonuclease